MSRRPRPAASNVAFFLVVLALVAFAASGERGRLNLSDWAERAAARAVQQEAEEVAAERHGPEDLYLFQRTVGGTAMPTAAIRERAGQQADRLLARSKRKAPKFTKKKWSSLGPTNIGARVTDMVTDVSLPDTLWVAAATGGVWVSRDAGKTFGYAWHDRLPQSIGAIAQAPDGTLYVGTGETNPGGGSLTYHGDGVYKSTDRGQTWQHIGLEGSSTIGRIVVDPGNSNHVWVAVSG
ncbi:MAG: glycoside hydrolase, partial [Actinomycetota bacterium]|nr:glycoside hydrolase [Actinomycetota bacterium]